MDADRFAVLADATDVDRLGAALALWRGQAYADVADQEFARAEATRLTEQRLVVHERLAEARLARGEHDLVAAELAELVELHPLREGLRALHIRALYAAGRQAEALESYAGLRERLADELGLDPGPELAALYRQILDQDPGLSAPPKAAIVRNSLPAQLDELIGRAEAARGAAHPDPGRPAAHPGRAGRSGQDPARHGGRGASRCSRTACTWWSWRRCRRRTRGWPSRCSGCSACTRRRGTTGSAADRLVAALRHREMLLVLDNCEHVIEAAAALVGRLLRDAPGVRVLATSREPLLLAGERVWEVGPLALPSDPADVDAVRRSAAARLFAARAAAQHRGFRLDEQTAPAVAQLCRRLDGLPLALELAATRVRALGVQGVVDRLDDRFRLLTTRQRDVPERQRTLTAVIAWSWDLLDPEDRVVLARLSVFRDGCTPEAAEAGVRRRPGRRGPARGAVARGGRAGAALPAAGVGRGVRRCASSPMPPRSAAGMPRTSGRSPSAPTPCCAAPSSGSGSRSWTPSGPTCRRRSPTAAACGWRSRSPGTGSCGAGSARHAPPWRRSGTAGEERLAAPWRLGLALLQGEQVPSAVRDVLALDPAGRSAWFVAHAVLDRGDLALAAALLPEEFDDSWTEAAVLASRAMLAHAAGDLPALEAAATRSDALFAELGDRWGRLRASDWLGGLAEFRGQHERAAAMHREGLRWATELSLWPEVGGKLSWLAWLAVQGRDYTRSRGNWRNARTGWPSSRARRPRWSSPR